MAATTELAAGTGAPTVTQTPMDKSFLVLFSKKNRLLAFL
jgi:hypothetical protein